MTSKTVKGGTRSRKRRNTRSFTNDGTASEYAAAVDRFFHGFPNKDLLFRIVTREEERDAIDRLGDNRTELENYLITHNIFLAVNLASHYSRMYSDYNDLISNAMFGLSEAARKFDVGKNIRFNTYATHWILKYIRHPFYNDTYNRKISANVSVLLDSADFQRERDDNCPSYSAFIKSVEPTFVHRLKSIKTPVEHIEDEMDAEDRTALIDRITSSVNASSLTKTDKRVYAELFINGKRIKDISNDIGTSVMTVIKSKKRISEYISKNFSDMRKSV